MSLFVHEQGHQMYLGFLMRCLYSMSSLLSSSRMAPRFLLGTYRMQHVGLCRLHWKAVLLCLGWLTASDCVCWMPLVGMVSPLDIVSRFMWWNKHHYWRGCYGLVRCDFNSYILSLLWQSLFSECVFHGRSNWWRGTIGCVLIVGMAFC